MTIDAHEIVGHTWTLRQLFTGRRFAVADYQRGYVWAREQVAELVHDLTRRYLSQRRSGHQLSDIAGYQPYFLGTIVTTRGDGVSLLVDGQQRVITLTLLLIYLYRAQVTRGDPPTVLPLITSRYDRGGPLNLHLDPGGRALDRLVEQGADDVPDDLVGLDDLLFDRFRDVEDAFPRELGDEHLPGFLEWALNRVILVEVETADPELAGRIFETTNDRGRPLTGADLAGAAVLARVPPGERPDLARVWDGRMAALAALDPNAPGDFLRGWLWARYARDGADEEAIESSPHRYLADQLPEWEPGELPDLVRVEVDRLAARYGELRTAARSLTSGLESVYYNAYNHLTLQYPLILAAIGPEDDDGAFRAKAALVAGALDIFAARCMMTGADFGYATVRPRLLGLARELRGLDADKLAARLGETLLGGEYPGPGAATFGLTSRNRAQVRYLLARMTAWLDRRCGLDTDFGTYTSADDPYEVEQVLADRPELRPELDPRRFAELRNRFGALVLLPRGVRAGLRNLGYLRKLERYRTQNMLARSLHPAAYEDVPALGALIEQEWVPFAPVPLDFDEGAVARRQAIYRRLVELVWDASAYPVASGEPLVPAATRLHPGSHR